MTWHSLVENGSFDISGVHVHLHGNGSDSVWVRPPQVTHHATIGDASDDPSFYPTDESVPVGPIASKKRAAEVHVHQPNEKDGESVLKRQKISCDEESSYTTMPEPDLIDNDDEDEDEEEPSFATKLARLLLAINGMKPS